MSRRRPPGHGVFPFYLERFGARRDYASGYPIHFRERFAAEEALWEVRKRHGAVVRRYRQARGLRVQIGCGRHARSGWVNLDSRALPGVDCVFDARKKLPFADRSVRMIFAEHFLEHLDYSEEVPLFLSECLRCLEPAGPIRLVVPDAGRYLSAYARGGWSDLAGLRGLDRRHRDPWLGGRVTTPMELVNLVFRQGDEHRFAYDAATLRHALALQGFVSIRRCRPGRSRHPELALDRPERVSESLYVEAEKAPSRNPVTIAS